MFIARAIARALARFRARSRSRDEKNGRKKHRDVPFFSYANSQWRLFFGGARGRCASAFVRSAFFQFDFKA